MRSANRLSGSDCSQTRTGEVGEEESFASEQRGFDATHELDVVAHARLQSHQAPGVNA